ncbi:hypothetical protein HUU05_06305 [candidate division KSB1 bacterium]|nr:hypothetical protein [candidate division KSB1 bacterium]
MTLYIIATATLLLGATLWLAYRQAQDERPMSEDELEKQRENDEDLMQ